MNAIHELSTEDLKQVRIKEGKRWICISLFLFVVCVFFFIFYLFFF
jgi:hypothetical protein